MVDGKFLILGVLVVALLFVVGFQSASILTPFTAVTLSDDHQYWVASWVVDGERVGDTTYGTLSSKNVTEDGKTFSIPRDNGFLMTATALQPYARVSVSEVGWLKNNAGNKVLSKFNVPYLGEKHAPFVFDVSDKNDKGGSFSYDTFNSQDQFTIPGTQVSVNVMGQLEKGYVDPDVSNILIFKGFNSIVCGSGVNSCDWQVDRQAFNSHVLTREEISKYGFPIPPIILYTPTPSATFDKIKDGSLCSYDCAEKFSSALRQWAALNPPLGFAQSVVYNGFRNPLDGRVETAKVHWKYPAKSFSSVVNVKIPLAMANTFVYDIPTLQSCSLAILQTTFNNIDADGSTQSVKIKNTGGASCSVSALFRVKTGYSSIYFFPNPVASELRVGEETTLTVQSNPQQATNAISSTVCVVVSQSGGSLPEQCGSITVDTGGTPPLPTPTPTPSPQPTPTGFQIDWNLVVAIGIALLLAYGFYSGKIDLGDLNFKDFIIPAIVMLVVYLVLAVFELPLVGAVFRGIALQIGLLVGLFVYVKELF